MATRTYSKHYPCKTDVCGDIFDNILSARSHIPISCISGTVVKKNQTKKNLSKFSKRKYGDNKENLPYVGYTKRPTRSPRLKTRRDNSSTHRNQYEDEDVSTDTESTLADDEDSDLGVSAAPTTAQHSLNAQKRICVGQGQVDHVPPGDSASQELHATPRSGISHGRSSLGSCATSRWSQETSTAIGSTCEDSTFHGVLSLSSRYTWTYSTIPSGEELPEKLRDAADIPGQDNLPLSRYSETCLERPHIRAVALDRWSLFKERVKALSPEYPVEYLRSKRARYKTPYQDHDHLSSSEDDIVLMSPESEGTPEIHSLPQSLTVVSPAVLPLNSTLLDESHALSRAVALRLQNISPIFEGIIADKPTTHPPKQQRDDPIAADQGSSVFPTTAGNSSAGANHMQCIQETPVSEKPHNNPSSTHGGRLRLHSSKTINKESKVVTVPVIPDICSHASVGVKPLLVSGTSKPDCQPSKHLEVRQLPYKNTVITSTPYQSSPINENGPLGFSVDLSSVCPSLNSSELQFNDTTVVNSAEIHVSTPDTTPIPPEVHLIEDRRLQDNKESPGSPEKLESCCSNSKSPQTNTTTRHSMPNRGTQTKDEEPMKCQVGSKSQKKVAQRKEQDEMLQEEQRFEESDSATARVIREVLDRSSAATAAPSVRTRACCNPAARYSEESEEGGKGASSHVTFGGETLISDHGSFLHRDLRPSLSPYKYLPVNVPECILTTLGPVPSLPAMRLTAKSPLRMSYTMIRRKIPTDVLELI